MKTAPKEPRGWWGREWDWAKSSERRGWLLAGLALGAVAFAVLLTLGAVSLMAGQKAPGVAFLITAPVALMAAFGVNYWMERGHE